MEVQKRKPLYGSLFVLFGLSKKSWYKRFSNSMYKLINLKIKHSFTIPWRLWLNHIYMNAIKNTIISRGISQNSVLAYIINAKWYLQHMKILSIIPCVWMIQNVKIKTFRLLLDKSLWMFTWAERYSLYFMLRNENCYWKLPKNLLLNRIQSI